MISHTTVLLSCIVFSLYMVVYVWGWGWNSTVGMRGEGKCSDCHVSLRTPSPPPLLMQALILWRRRRGRNCCGCQLRECQSKRSSLVSLCAAVVEVEVVQVVHSYSGVTPAPNHTMAAVETRMVSVLVGGAVQV